MPFENIRGMKAYVEMNGKGKPGIPLLLVHGAGGNHLLWEEQVHALALNRQVIAVDLPGHGKSEGTAFSTISAYAEWIEECIDAFFGNRKIVLGGHSMGGAIAQVASLYFPEKLAGVLLIHTGAKLKVRPEVISSLSEGIRERKSFLAAFSPKTRRSIIDLIDSDLELTPAESRFQDYMACDAFDLREEISRIDLPVLVVGGEDDAVTPPKFSFYLHDKIRRSKLAMIADAGHYAMCEQPALLNRLIEDFMEGIDSEAR